MDFLSGVNLDNISVTVFLGLNALAIITGKLIWHTRYEELKADRDRWMEIAIEALQTGTATAVGTAEIAVGVVSSLPDPQGERNRASIQREGG